MAEVNATHLSDIGMIRIHFTGLQQEAPELFMDYSLARATIKALQECLPEQFVQEQT